MNYNLFVGQIIKHPIRHELLGTITELVELEAEVCVSWHDGTESQIYACLAEPFDPRNIVNIHEETESNPQNFETGDRVCFAEERPIKDTGTITKLGYSHCVVKWDCSFGITTELMTDLELYEKHDQFGWVPDEQKDPTYNHKDPEFCVGERVFFIKSPLFPMGVVVGFNISGLFDSKSEQFFIYEIVWDNGLRTEHKRSDLGSCEKMVKHLTLPVPVIEAI